MPFTVSHIAAVVPLKRLRLPFSALAIGSMSPDFSYIIELYGPYFEAHSLWGLFYFCVPISYLTWVIYSRYLRQAWTQLFPWLAEDQEEASWGSVITAVAIGAGSHIIWDGFTHGHGWAVQVLPVLKRHVFFFADHDIRLFKVLQHGSSLVGGLIVALSVIHKVRQSTHQLIVTSRNEFLKLCGMTITLATALCVPLFYRIAMNFFSAPLESVLIAIAFRSLAAMACVAIIYPLRFAKNSN